MNEKSPLTPTAPRRQVILRLLLLLSLVGITAWATYSLRLHRSAPGMPALSVGSLMPVGEWYTVADQTPGEPLVLALTRDHEERRVRIGGVAEPKDAAEAERIAARLRELVPPNSAVFVEIEPRGADDTREAAIATVLVPPPGADPKEPFPYDTSQMLGAVLIQEGLARVDTEQLYRYRTEFESLEADARRWHRGLWAAPAP
jgi:endonuclease YncB( thermonuclease family)